MGWCLISTKTNLPLTVPDSKRILPVTYSLPVRTQLLSQVRTNTLPCSGLLQGTVSLSPLLPPSSKPAIIPQPTSHPTIKTCSWRQHLPPKYQYIPTRIHVVKPRKPHSVCQQTVALISVISSIYCMFALQCNTL
jgi:hypothetical protein